MMTAHDPKQAIIDDLCHPRLTSSGIGPAVEGTIHFLRNNSSGQKVQVPVQVEVYNSSGELLGTQIAFDYESTIGKPLREKPKN
ncbi:MAG TPA: hypothetical protein DHW02_12640 [Ktedonobacter sp.]|nr:hypothetical protein [Ktedonobacter sp.]